MVHKHCSLQLSSTPTVYLWHEISMWISVDITSGGYVCCLHQLCSVVQCAPGAWHGFAL